MQVLRNVISGGEPSALLRNEASHFLTKEEKRSLINDAGIVDMGQVKICKWEATLLIRDHTVHYAASHTCTCRLSSLLVL